MPEYELLIKNGTIVEGTRIPAFKGDIGINGGRITAMGNLTGSATRVIDATGLIVAPGFIDLHTHYDAALSGGTKWDPYASLSGWHGVTTVAIGNCGFGFAPVKPEDRDRAMRLLGHLQWRKSRLRWRLPADACGAARRDARDGGGVARVQSRLDRVDAWHLVAWAGPALPP